MGIPTVKNTLPDKALIHIWWRDEKLYRQAKGKTVQHHQTSFTKNVTGISLSKKLKITTTKHEKYEKKKLISKGKYTIKVVY